MNKQNVIDTISSKLKLIRVERGYTQDRMATVLGISKKTLVQIEKGRAAANWSTVVTVCALFRNSDVVIHLLGGDVLEVIETIAHDFVEEPKDRTMGGKIWWKKIEEEAGYTLQQNVISQHFRIIDEQKNRMYSCLDKEEAELKLKEITSVLRNSS
ncbi:helix-turn-helix domain-containing protein [Aquibacillus koreensis]|uniref:Helix-turn-helix domain-containing protein n=1 Tax=Aquibacillus koreensis TaxID=279446 RepID=A0A9X3WFJ0_9BACI|nr:helix-turn-helix domain-containing protein [Aquibacillus koreensis]MCT2537419.1 helix-turn-helix domain-containing protein [Aquibacillus koreensis]MDC3418865.1 helix-turn-helix domain-containing protein [Aquibacillus koreensis]